MQKAFSKNVISAIAIGIMVGMLLFAFFGWYMGWFRDLNSMRAFVGRAGFLGPVVFLVLQVLQVVLPFIPGGVTLMTGVAAFGPVWGFALNYSGVLAGSMINFLLAKKYGKPIVTSMVDESTYNKYIGKLSNSKGFERFFAIAILLPFFPDDTLCLLAGLTKMPPKKFLAIIAIAKPPTIAVYSFVMLSAGHMFRFLT